MTCVLNMILEIDYLRTPLGYREKGLSLEHSHKAIYGMQTMSVGYNYVELSFICGEYTHYVLNRLKNVQYMDGVL